jgi:ubiquinone/menaquinone biosynthesis C-methylase UbiE
MKNRRQSVSGIQYHLNELKIALDPKDPRHCMPTIEPGERSILEIGCGIGQMFVASRPAKDVSAVGIDVDFDALKYGNERYDCVEFVQASGESLPFADNSFDLIISRVSIPLMNVPQAIREVARTVKPGGRIWLSLLPLALVRERLKTDARQLRLKDFVMSIYIIINGLILHSTGRVVPFAPTGAYESFQTSRRMRTLLRQAGFSDIEIKRSNHFVVTAKKA